MIKLSKDLSLPLEVVTQKQAFIGCTGSGKTYALGVLAEGLLANGIQTVILDPVGVWYGLRISASGKGPGISIPVFGGLKGDIPLEPTAGALIADLIVDRNISCVIDVSQFESDADKARFATAFATRFFFRKKSSPSPVHLIIEECQEFIPQECQRGEEHMLHAFQRIWKIGRNFGIGGSLASQRPQEVNKKVLNQSQTLYAFRLTGHHERKAMELWMKEKDGDLDLIGTLPSIQTGHCRVWSPEFLKKNEMIAIGRKTTFDSSSTPSLNEAKQSRPLAKVDLADLGEQIKATVERAKAEDPKHLRTELAKAQKIIVELKAAPAAVVKIQREEVPVFSKGDIARLFDIQNALADMGVTLAEFKKDVGDMWHKATKPLFTARPGKALVGIPAATPTKVFRTPIQTSEPQGEARKLGGGMKRMLIAIAQRPGLNRRQLGLRAGLSSTSGSFSTYLSALRSGGFIDEENGGFRILPFGERELGDYSPLPQGEALRNYWLGELGNGGANRILAAVCEAYPNGYSREELGSVTGLSPSSGSFSTYLSKLRTLELISGKDVIKASDELFD